MSASLRLYWDELRAIARSGPRMILYRALIRDPAPRPQRRRSCYCTACSAMPASGVDCSDLRARGIAPVHTLSYGPPPASIELFAEQVAARIDAILRETGAARVAIVGHSMGGLVARATCAATARRISTIMSGCATTAACTRGSFPEHASVNCARGSMARRTELPRSRRPQRVWYRCGPGTTLMVAPQTSARLDGAKSVELIGIGYNALLYDRRVHALVAEELERVAAEEARR